MAILNLTPDSFSGDSLGGNANAALPAALRAVDDGADILDLGAESTRPGHVPISADEELARLLPAFTAIRASTDVLISVDTSKAAVAAEAITAGANLINDVRGFTADPEMAAVVARAGVPAVIMHDVPPEPGDDLMTSILRELSRRLDRAVAAGVAWDKLIVDPGFGFGKDWRQNLELLRRLGELKALERPILSGTSRKSMIGRVLGVAEDDRLEGTAATVSLAIAGGADIVRVHDVRAMARVARMTDAVVRGAPREPLNWPGAAALTTMATAYIALGSNLGDRMTTLGTAVQRLESLGRVTRVSSLYQTEPVGYLEQPPFLNAVAALKTVLAPIDFLHALLGIERDLGRMRTFPNAPRTVDLDLLLVDDVILDTTELTLPHLRLHERAFVLIPLAEIAPEAVHPVSGKTIWDLLGALPDRDGVEVYAPAGWEPAPSRVG